MKYSQETLRNAIYFIIPGFKTAVDAGCNMNLPTMLKDAAVECFMNQPLANSSFDFGMAEIIIRMAIIDMNKLGQFEFGEQEFIFKGGKIDAIWCN